MQVTNFTVRYMRKIQVREYEPAEAEVSFSAVVAEGEDDYAGMADDLMLDAKAAVRVGLLTKIPEAKASAAEKKVATDKANEDVAPAADDIPEEETKPASKPKAKPAAKKKAATKKAAAKKATTKKADKPADDDIPGDDDDIPGEESKGNISENPEDRTDPNDDIPGEEDDIPGEDGDSDLDDLLGGEDEAFTHKDLHEMVSSLVNGGKLSGANVKEILGGYNAARVRDVPEDKLTKVRDILKAKAEG